MKGNIFDIVRMKNQSNIKDRKKLKAFFEKGKLPTAQNFHMLIDSTFNKSDDKLDIDEEDGLMIYPAKEGKLLSFFENIDDNEAKWVIKNPKKKGIAVNEEKTEDSKEKKPALFLQNGGKIGVGTNTPNQKLDVKGIVASHGRIGNYHQGEVKANGAWHNIFSTHLDGCHAYEIMASAQGKKGKGKYALIHAIAVSTFGNSRPKITKTSAYFGTRWSDLNKIMLRWESRPSKLKEGASDTEKPLGIGAWWRNVKSLLFEAKDTHNYNLQVKTKRNYGDDIKIQYKVSLLWDDDFTNTTDEPE